MSFWEKWNKNWNFEKKMDYVIIWTITVITVTDNRDFHFFFYCINYRSEQQVYDRAVNDSGGRL